MQRVLKTISRAVDSFCSLLKSLLVYVSFFCVLVFLGLVIYYVIMGSLISALIMGILMIICAILNYIL